MNALLIGAEPMCHLGYTYVQKPPYEGVVIGSLTLGELLCFREDAVLEALAEGKPVVLYTPGLPQAKNRSLSASVASARRQLKNWGVVFTDGTPKRLITAKDAQRLRELGQMPGRGAMLTPLAKEILEGKS